MSLITSTPMCHPMFRSKETNKSSPSRCVLMLSSRKKGCFRLPRWKFLLASCGRCCFVHFSIGNRFSLGLVEMLHVIALLQNDSLSLFNYLRIF
uniref:Uncharacterized protein n=1 Tax=Oryza brachyantha TaxID=4533 RepID=J3MQN1_ORYBR